MSFLKIYTMPVKVLLFFFVFCWCEAANSATKDYLTMGIEAGADVPFGRNLNRQVWNFNYDADSNKTISNVRFHPIIGPSVALYAGWEHSFYHNAKKVINAQLTVGVGYQYHAYQLQWDGEYTVNGSGGAYPVRLELQRRQYSLLLPVAVSVSIRKVRIALRNSYSYMFDQSRGLKYQQNGQQIYNELNRGMSFNCSVGIGVGYELAVSQELLLIPHIAADMLLGDMISIGQVNRRLSIIQAQISAGIDLRLSFLHKGKI
jgi:hypothetical protein